MVADVAKTKLRSFRCDDETWDPAAEKAEAAGDNLSDVLRQALISYAAAPAPEEQK